MYADIKSCVTLNNNTSSMFSCTSVVRQGENLSPLLFSLYLNDLESYLQICRHKGVDIETQSEKCISIDKFLSCCMLTIQSSFQKTQKIFKTVSSFLDYCAAWKLNMN